MSPSQPVPHARAARRRAARTAALVAGATLVAPSAAHADWQDLPLPDGGTSRSGVVVSVGGRGDLAVASSPTSNLADPWSSPANVLRLASKPAGGAWTSRTITEGPDTEILPPSVTVRPDGSGLAAWRTRSASASVDNPTGQAVAELGARTGWDATPRAFVDPIQTGQTGDRQTIVPAADGTYVAVWTAGNTLWAATRRVDGSWEIPHRLGTDLTKIVAVLKSPSGQIVPVWVSTTYAGRKTDRVVNAARRLPDGTWQDVQRYDRFYGYGPIRRRTGNIAAGIDGYDNVTIAYDTNSEADDGVTEAPEYANVVDAATLKPGKRWSAPTRIQQPVPSTEFRGTPFSEQRLTSVTGTRYGNAVVTWTDRGTEGGTRVRSAIADSEQHWGAPRTVDTSPKGDELRFETVAAVENPAQGVVTITYERRRQNGGNGELFARDLYPWDDSASQRFRIPVRDGVYETFGNAPIDLEPGRLPQVTDRGDTLITYGYGSAGLAYGIVADDVSGPVLGALAPWSAAVGVAQSRTITAVDTFSSTAKVRWDFGDGTGATGTTVSHAWSKAGTYVVSVTATDVHGNVSSTSTTATIGAGAAARTAAPAPAAAQARTRSTTSAGVGGATPRASGGPLRILGVTLRPGHLELRTSGPAALNVAIQKRHRTVVRRGGKRIVRTAYTPLRSLQADPGVGGRIDVQVARLHRSGYRIIVSRRGTEGRPVRTVTFDR